MNAPPGPGGEVGAEQARNEDRCHQVERDGAHPDPETGIGRGERDHDGQPPDVQNSVVAKLGHTIEPVIRPLGFDWKIGVGLVTSLAAREVIIATLGTLNGVDPESHSTDLQAALRHELTPAAAVALLVFFAFAMQCMSTLAVVRRETNGWKWPAIQFTYMTIVAYVSAFAAYNIVGHFVH